MNPQKRENAVLANPIMMMMMMNIVVSRMMMMMMMNIVVSRMMMIMKRKIDDDDCEHDDNARC